MLLLFSATTFLLLTNISRFVVVGDQLVIDPLFRVGIQHWQQQGPGEVFHRTGIVTLSSLNRGTFIVYQSIPIDLPGYYRLSFEAKAENITLSSGAGSWAGAGVLLRYVKNGGVRKYGTPTIVSDASKDKKLYQIDSHIRADVHSVDVAMWIKEASGQFLVEKIGLSRLDETGVYSLLKWIVVGFWLLVGAWLVFSVWPILPIYNFVGIALLCGIALVGALMPEAFLNLIIHKVSALSSQTLQSQTSEAMWQVIGTKTQRTESNEVVSMMGHFLVFAGLGVFAGLNGHKFGLLFLAASTIVFALITEVLQLLVARRTASLSDLIVDVAGVLFGLTLSFAFLYLYKKLLG